MKPHYNPAYSLDMAAHSHGQRFAIHYGETSYTVLEATLITKQLAAMLGDIGVGQGDRVALIARNSPYHMLLHVACARIGAVFVPISYRFAGPELADVLDFAQPRVVVADLESSRIQKRHGVSYFVIDDDVEFSSLTNGYPKGFQGLSACYRKSHPMEATAWKTGLAVDTNVSEVDGGAMLFTSGSTGRPKAVYLTHEQLWWGSQNFREGFEYSNHDVELVTVPLTHIGGFNGTTLDLFSHGGTIVIVREFDPGRVLQELERHRVAMMFAVPTMYSALLAHPDFSQRDLTAFRLPLIGGAICPPALLARMEESGLRPLNVWGMTETGGAGFMLSQDLLAQARGSIGSPFAHVSAKIIDEFGQEADTGELVISGPHVVHSYWNDPSFTAEAFRDGWLLTGDMARRDAEGHVWIVGRTRYQINTGGEKVIPEEVSSVLLQMPQIVDAAVVGIPDETWGEAVAAAIVVKPGEQAPDLGTIRDFVASHIARYKAPRAVCVVPSLPTNANGKTDMAQIKKMCLDARKG
ncbi:class I adenylate-forming enzyme family protein [Arcanobacterium buesumense]|uniref:Long-chain fatty acid--CoA ligase n=1 Tax=Arcanobacterium buesumense TaxID=2722751 RepID=A0A6H2EMR2_9ACTO|nr:AMP-binding protein [Arcanobacterium buesumense]QJC22363.1 long-chain fatty acid--CoA ligase [Arcanobacterium buesumense]